MADDRPTLFITIQDGMVDSIQSNDPALQNIRVVVIDQDTDASPERALEVLQDDGRVMSAALGDAQIYPTSFDTASVLNFLGEGSPPTEDEVDDAVEAWHNSRDDMKLSLHGYLGWTLDEYSTWVRHPDQIPNRPLAKR